MPIDQSKKARAFLALHSGPATFVIPNPWDAGSARILAALGFAALATTSAGFAHSAGRKDGGVSRNNMIAHVGAIAGATDLPVSADLENCYADDPEEAAETLRLAAQAGAVGGSIEDHSGDPDRPIYEFEHAVERVAAAVEAVRKLEFPFTLTARAENFLRGRSDLDDTIRRLQAFDRAGADVLYAPGLREIAQIRTLCASVGKPVNALAVPGLTVTDLNAAGVRRVSIGSALQRLAVTSLLDAAREMKERGEFSWLARATPFSVIAPMMTGADEA